MASLALQLKNYRHKTPKTLPKCTPNLAFLHLFSSSSSSDNNDNSPKRPSSSTFLSDIKSILKHQGQQKQQNQQSTGFRPVRASPQNPSKFVSFAEIGQHLGEFRRRSMVPPPGSPSPENSQRPNLLQDLYKKNMANPNPNPNRERPRKETLSYDTIYESVRQMRKSQAEKGQKVNEGLSLDKYKESFRPNHPMPEASKVYGGSSEELPVMVFGRELQERQKKKEEESKEGDDGDDDMAKARFFRMYTVDELGEKLRGLRPEVAKEEGGQDNWFSLVELNERLKKLREIEEKELVGKMGGLAELRHSLNRIRTESSEKVNKATAQKYLLMSGVDGTLNSMSPPKKHLVEKYFHPDNMSSAEKLKLELKKVRDGFKMHESDCGSARVQIAQLTTEINHLSSVLHKKDKHSRRGLLAKVQQRKKLLKYLRSTDWDSYCIVLSKLGLRDNPDYKN